MPAATVIGTGPVSFIKTLMAHVLHHSEDKCLVQKGTAFNTVFPLCSI
jgi:hypothetical protein